MKYTKGLFLVLVGAAFFGAVFLMGAGGVLAATEASNCPAPYHLLTWDNRCVWSCAAGTTPDHVSNECVCQPGYVETGLDQSGRRVCAPDEIVMPPAPFNGTTIATPRGGTYSEPQIVTLKVYDNWIENAIRDWSTGKLTDFQLLDLIDLWAKNSNPQDADIEAAITEWAAGNLDDFALLYLIDNWAEENQVTNDAAIETAVRNWAAGKLSDSQLLDLIDLWAKNNNPQDADIETAISDWAAGNKSDFDLLYLIDNWAEKNQVTSDAAIRSAINDWAAGRLDDFQLLDLIDLWAKNSNPQDTTIEAAIAEWAAGNLDDFALLYLIDSWAEKNPATNDTVTYYTTAEISIPENAWTKYTGPITIDKTTTLKFYSIDLAGNKEDVRTEVYTIGKPDRYVKVTSPNGGETLTVGQNYKITWDSSVNIDKVWLGYSFGVGSLDWIATDLDNTGSYDWKVNIGNTVNTQVKIRVIGFETGVGNADDESDNFFKVNPPNCALDSAFWEPNEATQGQTVKLNVTGTNCDGKKISFQVKEKEWGIDDAAKGILAATFANGKTTTDWTAERWDIFGNSYFYFVATLDDPGVPTFAPVTITSDDLTVKPRSGSDTEAPNITAFKIAPSEVDTSSQEQEFEVTMTLTDNNSGVCIYSMDKYITCSGFSTGVYLRQEGGSQDISFRNFERISGDELNGTYKGTAILPQGSANGKWVASLTLTDRLGNYTHLNAGDLGSKFGFGVAVVKNNASSYDIEAPRITALDISPHEVDTSSQEQEITVTMTLTDDNSGVCIYTGGDEPCFGLTTNVYLWKFEGGSRYVHFRNFERISGDKLNGTYKGTAILPQGSAKGEWEVSLALVDRMGNPNYLHKDDLNSMFGAGAATVKNEANISDETPPEVTFFEINPRIIYTDDQPQEVTVIMNIQDNSSGVCIYTGGYEPCSGSSTNVYIGKANGGSQYIYLSNFERISGDKLNGTYKGTAILPQGSANGEWEVSLDLADRLGSSQYYSKDDLEKMFGVGVATIDNTDGPVTTASYSSGIYNSSIDVELATNKPATTYYTLDGTEPSEQSLVYSAAITIEKTTELKFFSIDAEKRIEEIKTKLYTINIDPPIVVSFSLDPQQVNTESQNQQVTLTVTLEDSLPGVCIQLIGQENNCPGVQTVNALMEEENSRHAVGFTEFTKISGDEYYGTYQSKATMYRGTAAGEWRLRNLFLSDKQGNTQDLNFQDLEAKFGAGSATITNSSTKSDLTPPEATAFEITPHEVDTQSRDQAIKIKMTLADDNAGVCLFCEGATFYFILQNIEDYAAYLYTMDFKRVSGDELNGNYEGTLIMPKGSAEGTWRASLLLLDQAGNYRFYSSYNNELDAKFGEGSATVVNKHQPCQLTGTAWNMTSASKGDTVEFHVIGSNCDGEAVNVRIMEDDVVDVEAKIQPTNVYIQGNTVTKTWVAETGDTVGKSEYYTEAWLPSDTEKQNMITSSNKLVVSQEDTSPPLTSAYHAGGSYQSTTSVALNCNDFTGSGCAKTYYTIDGSEPSVNSAVYASELEISSATTLKFFSVDAIGNTEVVKTERYVIVPEQDSPIGHWKFDEESGDTALDAAGKNNGAITGATRTEGKIGGALSFGPGGDRVVLGNDPSLKVFPQKNWSFAAWINPTGEGDPWQTIFNGIWHKPWINFTPYQPEPDTDDGNGNGVGFGFFPKKVETLSGSFLWRTRSAANAVKSNEWNHVAVTSDGVNHKLFVNGTLAGTTPYLEISDVDHPHFRTHGGYIIGNIIEFDAPQSSFSGQIDDVRIYNKTLSEKEINALAQPSADTTDLAVFQSCWLKDVTISTNCAKADFDSSNFVGAEDFNMLKDAVTKYDLNGDGMINVSTTPESTDLGIFQSCWWKDTTVSIDCAKADFDGDNFVGPKDFNMLKDAVVKYDLNGDGMVDIRTTPINFIQVNSPNGGEFYKIGQTQRISWNAAGVTQVRIYIYDDRIDGSGSTNYLTPNNEPVLAANGFFDWEIKATDIPSPLTDSDEYHYKIRLEGSDNNGNVLAEDVSDNYFAVVNGIVFHPADVNHDGKINIKDIQNVIREIVGTNKVCITLADFNCELDVSKDGKINIKDIQAVIRAIVGKS